MSTNSAQSLWKFVCRKHPAGRIHQKVSKNVSFSSFSSSSCSIFNDINKVGTDRDRKIFSSDPKTVLNFSETNNGLSMCSYSSNLSFKRTFKIYPESYSRKDDDDDKKSKSEGVKFTEEKQYDPKKDDFFTQDTAFGSKENKGLGESERPVFIPEGEVKVISEEDLEPPTTCCQSGCPNCVWIEYVEKLSKFYTDPTLSKDKILKELDGIEDSNVKAFIMMELRVKKLI
ncbi:Oxidoreductase-like domain-containing protein 1 [Orchesella cincta]|uniref:Oxidoreductase-like domain-containing protein 1 n=1 Tax=Orchesella cincta TaxID=48709 RepID=A0A1D2NEP3_ORCCI|nr:Oxidoreductase-like domain-containing protein 1 [Orchesella cincta]